MAHGTVRSAAATVLGLIALQAVASRGGSGRVVELFQDVNGILQHALDPSVPAIPDLRNGGSWASTAPVTPLRSGAVSQGAGAAARFRIPPVPTN